MMNIKKMNIGMKTGGSIILGFYLTCIILFNILFVSFSMSQPNDFGSFIQAGLNAANGVNPYSSNGDLIFRVKIPSVGLDVKSPNLNPPISILFFEAIAKLGTPEFLSMLWRVISITLYILIILFLDKFYRESSEKRVLRLLWAFSLAGFWHAIQVGQIYIPFILMMSAAWVLIEQKKMFMAGILLGLILAIKPNFLILALILMAGGYFRLAITSIVTFMIVSILPALVYGIEIYAQWIQAINGYTGYALPNNSFVGLMVRFQHLEWGNILSFVLVFFIMAFIWRKKISIYLILGIGISVSLLSSPISWDSYTLFLLPYFYHQKEWLLAEKIGAGILTIIFIVPYFLFQQSFVEYVIFGWTYGWGILLILISQLRKIAMHKTSETLQMVGEL